jgi:hypothetical protein
MRWARSPSLLHMYVCFLCDDARRCGVLEQGIDCWLDWLRFDVPTFASPLVCRQPRPDSSRTLVTSGE